MASQANPSTLDFDPSPDAMEDFIRMPGLLRRWEIQQVVNPTSDYRIEPAGETEDGTPVFAVYYRVLGRADAADEGLPVTVCFEAGGAPVPCRLLPLDLGESVLGVLVVSHDVKDGALLARVREHLSREPHRPPSAAGPDGGCRASEE